MPFWKKKEPEVPQPHVEPGMGAAQSSEPNPIRFSDEPQFGTVHPSQTAVPPTRTPQPSDGEFATHPSAIQTPVAGAQKESFATVQPTSVAAREMPLHIEENPFAESSAAKEAPVEIKLDPETASQAAAKAKEEKAESQPEKRSWFKRAPKQDEQQYEEEELRRQKWIHARRRFVGTLMLLMAAAIAIPILFDKEAPPPAVTIPLRIPKENTVDVTKITVPPAPASEEGGEAKEDTKVPPVPSVNSSNASTVAVAPAGSGNTAVKAPEAKKDNEDAAKKAAEAKKAEEERKAAEAKKLAEAKKQTEAKKQAEARKQAEDKKSKETSAPKLAKGQYFIQVIALSNQNRAQGIVDKMKKAGVPAYLSPVQAKSGKIYRVQAGPFKSAKEAEAANAKLGLAGLNTGKVQAVR